MKCQGEKFVLYEMEMHLFREKNQPNKIHWFLLDVKMELSGLEYA